MMHVTPQNIRKLSGELRNLIGKDFFAEQVDSFSIDGLNLKNGFIKEQNAHPLALMWKAFLNDISNSEKKETLTLNTGSIICLHALMYLKDLRGVKNYHRILSDLKVKEKFYSTLFEARIAAEYRSKGYDLVVQDETGINKGGICDFIISLNGKKIYIECKSLNDLLKSERNFWNELTIRITNLLGNRNLNWNVEIYLGKEIEAKDVEKIYELLKADIDSKSKETRSLAENSIKIRKVEIKKEALDAIKETILISSNSNGNAGQMAIDQRQLALLSKDAMKLPEKHFDLESQGLLITKFKMQKGGIPSSLRAFRVSIFPHADFDLTKRFFSNIRKASKQIPKGEMGIIHVAVPHLIGNHLMQIVDNSYDNILNNLERNHSRINAVVLYGQFFERNPWGPLLSLHYIIPNMSPKSSLPQNFEIIGVENLNLEIPPEKGTVIFEFMVDPMWRPGLTYRIFHHSSPDGSYQLKLLTLPGKKLRLEIVTPIIRRIFLLSEKPINLRPAQHYKFAARWGEGEFAMFIDGNKIGSKDLKSNA